MGSFYNLLGNQHDRDLVGFAERTIFSAARYTIFGVQVK